MTSWQRRCISGLPRCTDAKSRSSALSPLAIDEAAPPQIQNQVIDLLPDNPNVLYNRGVVRSRMEKFDGARDDFNQVLAVSPQ